MEYFSYLNNTNLPLEDRFDLWDFNNLSEEQYIIIKNHPIDNLSVNLSSLPDTMYMASNIKLYENNVYGIYNNTNMLQIKTITDEFWKSEVIPIMKWRLKKYLNYPTLTAIAASPIPPPSEILYKYIISKTQCINFLRRSELWQKMNNKRYCFKLTLVPPHPGLFMGVNMYYNPCLIDPVFFQTFRHSKKQIFARPMICTLYKIDTIREPIYCRMCNRFTIDFYHPNCIKTDSGNDLLFYLFFCQRPVAYKVCHRFPYKFHSVQCLDHLNKNNSNKYKIFNNILYEKIENSNFLQFSKMLTIREYVIPSVALSHTCNHII